MVEVATEVNVSDLMPEFFDIPAPPPSPPKINIDIRLVGGRIIANFDVSPDDTVLAIKQQVRQRGLLRGVLHSRLVCGCRVLYDNDRLRECDIEARRVLTLVNVGHSTLAALVEEQGGAGEAGSIIDMVDSVLESKHDKTMEYLPDAAEVAAKFPEVTRNQVLQWLRVACDELFIEPALMHGAVLTLDRYSAGSRNPVAEGSLFRLCLAALCTEMKLANYFPHGYWQRILVHLGQGRESLQTILQTELQMLSALNFMVDVPTPMTFLGSLGLRFHNEAHVLGVAAFLVDLVLFNVTLQYMYPASVLAAGAIGASLFVHPHTPDQTAHMHAQLFEDILGFSRESDYAMRLALNECELGIITYWVECDQARPQYYRHTRTRHERAVQHLNPEEVLTRFMTLN